MAKIETVSVRVRPHTTMADRTKQRHSKLNNNRSKGKLIPHLLLNPNLIATFTG